MSSSIARRWLPVIVASLGLVAAGCGATGGADGTTQIVSSRVAPQAQRAAGVVDAAQATGKVTTLKVDLTVRTDPAGGDPSVDVSATAEVDAAKGRAHLRADVSGVIGGAHDAATVEAVSDGGTAYVKAPFVSSLFDGKPWVKVTSPELGALSDQLGGGLEPDPSRFLDLLEGAGGPVTTVGTEEVRGVPTRHVTVDLDVRKVLDQAAGGRRQELSDQLAEHGVDLGKLGPIPAEAWIDDDGHVRRFSVSFDLAAVGKVHPGAHATGVVTETIELYDFDEPVDIAVPPASEVATFDLGKVLESLPGRGAGHGN
jgi:hypothetical protein